MVVLPPRDTKGARRVAHKQHWGWWILTAFVAVIIAVLAKMLITNPNLHWDVVAHYFFYPPILFGVVTTLELTAIAMVLGVLIGLVTAVMRMSGIWILNWSAQTYIWFFRGTPLLVQIIFWYNLAALFPSISLGIPFTNLMAFSVETNSVVTPLIAGALALTLNNGAYMSEIVRSGLISVDQGQREAAKALGMRSGRILRRVIIPQAMRIIIPPTGNQVIGMLKFTSLVSVAAVTELLYSVQLIYNKTFQTIPLLVVASLWYLLMTTVLNIMQYYLERAYARGSAKGLPDTPFQKVRNFVRRQKALVRSYRGTSSALKEWK